jgi:hypothetical protein
MKNLIIYRFLFAAVLMGIWGCEDVIDVTLDEGESQLTVDAWVDILPQEQNIRLTMSGAYFSNQPNAAATGATVTITNLTQNTTFTFADQGNGDYTYDGTQEVLGELGDELTVNVAYLGEEFTAKTEVYGAPSFDSLIWKYEEEELGQPEGHYIEMFARDLPGKGSAYWIKTFKNGAYIDDPAYINYSVDGVFDLGFDVDEIIFITPIRFSALNYLDTDDSDKPPYVIGDQARVEIHGISLHAHQFLLELQEQTTNGGLFATPAYNLTTNISNVNPDSEVVALGFFNVAHRTSAEITVGD